LIITLKTVNDIGAIVNKTRFQKKGIFLLLLTVGIAAVTYYIGKKKMNARSVEINDGTDDAFGF
jgi:hypothetical protein